jgi:hypothetical protein
MIDESQHQLSEVDELPQNTDLQKSNSDLATSLVATFRDEQHS